MRPLALVLAIGFLAAWIPQSWPWHAVEGALCFLAAWRAFQGRILWRWSPWIIALVAGAAWPWVQLGFGTSVYSWETHAARLTWTAWLAAYCIASSSSRHGNRRWMMDAIAKFSGGLAVIVIAHRLILGGGAFENVYTGLVLLTMPVALWHASGWMLVVPALQAVSVFVSGSAETSILVGAEALLILAIHVSRQSARARAMAAVGFAAAAAIVLDAVERPEPWRERGALTRSALETAVARPVLGTGLGTWKTHDPGPAHGDWPEWLAEGGIPFLLAMLLMAGGAIGSAWRTGWAMGLAFVLAYCLIESVFHEQPMLGAAFFTVAGLARDPENY